MKPYAFGVDIGGTTIKMGFFDSEGKFIDKWEIPTHTENNGDKILPDIARSIKKKLKDNGLTLDDLEGVGIGVPGPVLSGGIVDMCVNLGWGVIDVRKQLSSFLDGVYVLRIPKILQQLADYSLFLFPGRSCISAYPVFRHDMFQVSAKCQ